MKLFNHLPDEIFRPLASASRAFFAELLLHLHGEFFESHGDTFSKSLVIAEIGRFIEENEERSAGLCEDDLVLTASEARDGDPRRYIAYRRLVMTGWLVEYRDRFRRLVDFDPDARLLLQHLAQLASGEVRSYGGAVLQVLSSLESAQANPAERSEAIRNAASFSGQFMQHLRIISAAMRKMEEEILSKKELREIFSAFFRDFVEKHLIQDYKSLNTANNPFRFRRDILAMVEEIAGNELLLRELDAAYLREGRAGDSEEARGIILRELGLVAKVFNHIDSHLEIIDVTRARIERRVVSTVKYMDRINNRRLDRVSDVLRALAALDMADDAEIPVPTALQPSETTLSAACLLMPRKPREPVGRQAMRRDPPDPVVQRFDEAKKEYRELVTVTPAKVEAYLSRALNGTRTEAIELPLESLEDFIVFRKLRVLPHLFEGRYQDRFTVEFSGCAFESDWLTCPDFTIVRKTQEEQSEASESDA